MLLVSFLLEKMFLLTGEDVLNATLERSEQINETRALEKQVIICTRNTLHEERQVAKQSDKVSNVSESFIPLTLDSRTSSVSRIPVYVSLLVDW